VLWVEVSNHKILLGSHLEKTADPSTGWSIILNDSNVTLGKAQVFKIPHHGSENAQHPDVWRELLVSEPFAIVTPFNRGGKTLPTPEDVTRILHATSHGYATSQIKQPRLKWRNRIVRDYLEQVTKSIHSLDPEWGQVRLRRAIDQIDDPWYVELFGAARALS
jgi:hypothetical protein